MTLVKFINIKPCHTEDRDKAYRKVAQDMSAAVIEKVGVVALVLCESCASPKSNVTY
jgi:hypothetical protein